MSAIRIENVSHEFVLSRRKNLRRTALSHVDLEVEKGCLFGLLGPNGGGKTTLFRILSTHLLPTSGAAFIFDENVSTHRAAVRRRIGVLFQNPSLDMKLTLRENLIHHGRLYGLSGATLADRIKNSLSQTGLEDRADEAAELLSGGMRRRGEIAKALLHDPSVLIMDEPGAGLDPGARLDLWANLKVLRRRGITILLTTHSTEEADQCDRLGFLHQGRLRAVGTPESLKSQIGGDVIIIRSAEPSVLRNQIKEKWGDDGVIVSNRIRFEKKGGHQLIPKIVDSFPNLVESVTVGRPTIEDVFIHVTGHRLNSADA